MFYKRFFIVMLLASLSSLKAGLPEEWQAYFFNSDNTKYNQPHKSVLPVNGVIRYKDKVFTPVKIRLEDELFDFDKLSQKRGDSAVVVGRIYSEKERKTWLGVGGLIFACHVNGKLVYDISRKGLGNDYDPVRSTDHIFPIELKKGENIIIFESLRTNFLQDYVYGKNRIIKWHLALREYPDYKPAKAELAHPEILIRPDKGSVQLTFITVAPMPAGVDYRVKGSDKWVRKWDTRGDLLLKEKTRVHCIRLSDLEPDTEYEYRIVLLEPPAGMDGLRRPLWSKRQYKECLMPVKKFRSFGDRKEYSFFVFGDTQLSLSTGCKTVEQRAEFMKKMRSIPAFDKADFLVHIGDMDSYFHEIDKDLFTKFFDYFADAPNPLQWVYVRGNHEVNGIGAEDWYDYFQMPGDKTFYAFSKGDVFFIVLDCGDFTYGKNVAGNGCLISMETLYAAQSAWIEKVRKSVAFKKARFRIVLAHPEPQMEYSEVANPIRKMVKNMLNDTSESGMIHLWIAGHVHRYRRAVRNSDELIHMQPAKKWVFSKAPVTWVTVDAPKGNSSWPDFSFLNVEVKNDRLAVSAYDIDGKVFDRFSIDEKGKVTEIFRRKDIKIQKLTDPKKSAK